MIGDQSIQQTDSNESAQDSQQHAPPPPQLNTLPLQNNSQTPPVQENLVPDLMKVYQCMAQSSTPQDTDAAAAPARSASTGYHQQCSESQHIQQTTNNSCEQYQHYHQAQVIPKSQEEQDYYAQQYISPPAASYQLNAPPTVLPVPEYPPRTIKDQLVSSDPPVNKPDPPPSTTTKSSSISNKRPLDKSNELKTEEFKTRKKESNMDGRWSKRFTWPDELHRDFVSAIFDVGLKHSSPSTILEHMPAHEQITSERIKSHLQKYRLHRTKSKKDFMGSYHASLNKFQNDGINRKLSLSEGQVAAHLSYSTTTNAYTTGSKASGKQEKEVEIISDAKPQQQMKQKDQDTELILPDLTEEEKKSPIGTSLGYLMGLFFSLRQQLMAQRATQVAVADLGDKGTVLPSTNGVHAQSGSTMQPISSQATTLIEEDYQAIPLTYIQEHALECKYDSKTPPSTSTNFVENKLMKQEMQNQMFFQTKMRDLKQREINRCKPAHEDVSLNDCKTADLTPNPVSTKKKESIIITKNDASTMSCCQRTGENAEVDDIGARDRLEGLSVRVNDEFLNTDIVDEQIFEFLMNP